MDFLFSFSELCYFDSVVYSCIVFDITWTYFTDFCCCEGFYSGGWI